MAWIELHQSLRTNPKVKRFADRLGIERAHATGILCNLWLWAVDHAKDGRLKRYEDGEIAEACWWQGDVRKLRTALKESGWEDSDGTIHDWSEYGIRLIEQAKQRKQRWLKGQQPSRKERT